MKKPGLYTTRKAREKGQYKVDSDRRRETEREHRKGWLVLTRVQEHTDGLDR